MGTPVSALFAELGDEPWDHRWWLRVIRFAGKEDAKPKGDFFFIPEADQHDLSLM